MVANAPEVKLPCGYSRLNTLGLGVYDGPVAQITSVEAAEDQHG